MLHLLASYAYVKSCSPLLHLAANVCSAYLIGVSLSEPHINVLNASGVCMYVCMYLYVVP